MTSTPSADNKFRRFTNLAAAIHLLQTNNITLLPPDTWDDQNDRHFMAVYKKRQSLKTLTAICLSQAPETYHHWKIFSPSNDGVCLILDRTKLLKVFNGALGVRHQEVQYEQIKKLSKLNPQVQDLPFIKRFPYEPESEYRILYESTKSKEMFKNFPLLEGTVIAVVLSPWMPQALVSSVKTTLKRIPGTDKIKIYSSTLISNQTWRAVADRAI